MSEILSYFQSRSQSDIGWLVDHFPVEQVRIFYRLYSVRFLPPRLSASPSTYGHVTPDANEFLAVYELDKKRLHRVVENIYQVHCRLIEHIDIPIIQRLQDLVTTHTLRNTFVRVYGLREGLPCVSIQFHGEMLSHEHHSEKVQSLHFALYDILKDARNCKESKVFELHAKPATAGQCSLMNQAITFERRMSQDFHFLVEDLTQYDTL